MVAGTRVGMRAGRGRAGDAVGDVLLHLALPLTALTVGLAANKFLIVRSTVIATLGQVAGAGQAVGKGPTGTARG